MMKSTLFTLLFLANLLIASMSNAQDYELKILKDDEGYPSVQIIDTKRGTSDLINSFGFEVDLLTYKIYDSTNVAFVFKDKVGYSYRKKIKIADDWETQPESGMIIRDPRRISIVRPLRNPVRLPVDSTFKIIERDKVEYYYGDEYIGSKRPSKKLEPERVVVDCEKFARRYYAKKKRYEEYLKEKEQEKENGDD